MHLVALETDAGLYCARQTQRVLRDWSFSGCLAGSRPALAAAVRTKGAGRRHTALAHRLHDTFTPSPEPAHHQAGPGIAIRLALTSRPAATSACPLRPSRRFTRASVRTEFRLGWARAILQT